MKKRYKRLIYTFEHSVEVYEYLDGKYGAPGTKRGKKRKATLEEIRFRNQWNRERKARHKLKTWFHENDYLVLFTYKRISAHLIWRLQKASGASHEEGERKI